MKAIGGCVALIGYASATATSQRLKASASNERSVASFRNPSNRLLRMLPYVLRVVDSRLAVLIHSSA